MDESVPLILLSGMGADGRMFARQAEVFPELRVPQWLPPRKGETLKQFARRMSEQIGDRPCFIGGASFGGFLALEMLPWINARGCFLIGALRSPAEYPFWIRALRPAHALCRIVPFQLFLWLSGFLGVTFGRILPRRVREFLLLGGSLDPVFFRWAAEAVLTWGIDGPPPGTNVPIYHIHGGRDHILPVRLTHPDEIVPRGGHVISLSNPREVNEFLQRYIDRAKAEGSTRNG